ncbi:MAG: 3-phosphoshikimate 1-carboxyvinyltransferase [Flavobacteriaceae bacterium]
MSAVRIHLKRDLKSSAIRLTGSKSETNRVLLLKALYPNLMLINDSNAHDVEMMKRGIEQISGEVDIHHAGTAMRFLTAYFASLDGAAIILTGSDRMKQRPIGVLVDALVELGADVRYLENPGFPPLQISGKQLRGGHLKIRADISSQYLSALCLVAPKFSEGLALTFDGTLTSVPYLKMTLKLLNAIGVETYLDEKGLRIAPLSAIRDQSLAVESDWSAASYYYSIIALSPIGTQVQLSVLKSDSLQGDRVLADIYTEFGVETTFENDGSIMLRKSSAAESRSYAFDLKDAPDIAQTIAVTAAGLGVECTMIGLHTLPIKETDRLAAMKTELEKCGLAVAISSNSLKVHARSTELKSAAIETYNDHRMAMAFAPLAIMVPLEIRDPNVVEKSYPDFWNDLSLLGFDCSLQAE